MKRFGARSDIIGQSVTLSGDAYTIVGVLPREFSFAPRGDAEFWTPLLDKNGCEQRRSCHNLDGIGRLRDGVTMQQALDGCLRPLPRNLRTNIPDSNKDQGASVIPLSELIVGDVRPILLTLLGGAGLLLLIACVNVASLLLVRSESSATRDGGARRAGRHAGARSCASLSPRACCSPAAASVAGLLAASWIMSPAESQLIPKSDRGSTCRSRYVRPEFAHMGRRRPPIALLATLMMAATPTMRLSFQHIRDGLSEGGPRRRRPILAAHGR